jgi:hypothetical protein
MGGGGNIGGAILGLAELIGEGFLDLVAGDELSQYLYLIGRAAEAANLKMALELAQAPGNLLVTTVLYILAWMGINFVSDGALTEMNNAYAQGRRPVLYRTGDIVFAGSGNTQVYRIKEVPGIGTGV